MIILKKYCRALLNNNRAGFTLVELIVSVAIIAIISGFSFSGYKIFQSKNDIDTAKQTVVVSLRRAQLLSQSVNGDSKWGVRVEKGAAIIFKGETYATRDQLADEKYLMPDTISILGLSEITYTKLHGFPDAIGTITLSGPSDSGSVTINSKGTIEYE